MHKNNDSFKALIAMSGGVDSSVAACIMKERGFDCMGVTMKLFQNEDGAEYGSHSCCSLDDVEDAKSVARQLGIAHYGFYFTDKFAQCVIDKFIRSYENGITPNPCIDCNRYLKFEKLFQRARELEYDYVVTGHYARICFDETSGRYLLKKGVDAGKDQSYVLYSMTQEQLRHTLFPVGELSKAKVRYSQTEQWARVQIIDDDTLRVEFEEPQRAVTKGQAVVIYDENIVVGAEQ